MLKNQKGTALIEMAIILPIFIGLLLAIVDFGLYFNERNIAQSAAYNAAKDCATPTPILPSKTSSMGVTLETMNLYGRIDNTPACTGPSEYSQVDIRIKGSMVSIFTRTLGLYNFTVTGIAAN